MPQFKFRIITSCNETVWIQRTSKLGHIWGILETEFKMMLSADNAPLLWVRRRKSPLQALPRTNGLFQEGPYKIQNSEEKITLQWSWWINFVTERRLKWKLGTKKNLGNTQIICKSNCANVRNWNSEQVGRLILKGLDKAWIELK